MLLEAVWIGFAFSLGLLVRLIGLPPLIGYLAAGFVITASATELDLPKKAMPLLLMLLTLGVLLLLYSLLGLKLNIRQLGKPEVLGGSLAHFAAQPCFIPLSSI